MKQTQVKINIDEIKGYSRNNKIHTAEQIDVIRKSIVDYWYVQNIVIDEKNNIVIWHWRLQAIKQLREMWSRWQDIEVLKLEWYTDKQIRKLRIIDNKTNEMTGFDLENLKFELDNLWDFEMDELFEDMEELENLDNNNYERTENSDWRLVEKFLCPPFSILDTKQWYWQERKRVWMLIWIESEMGRDGALLGDWLASLAKKVEEKSKTYEKQNWTSVFDPVLSEICYTRFNIKWWSILDPFAGWSVRWIVAWKLWYDYYWNDLRKEQIEANKEQLHIIDESKWEKKPNWSCWDSLDIDKIITDKQFDMIFSCPPYADLEVYSDNEKDLSNMDYNKFVDIYNKIIKKSCDMLKDNSFAVFVVWDVRDKKWFYYNFVDDTKKAFLEAWLWFYNEIVLLNAIWTWALRANKTFQSWRKVVKTHQNVMVFYKWDPKQIKEKYWDVEVADVIDETE